MTDATPSTKSRASGALTVEDLKVHFGGSRTLFAKGAALVHAVDGVSFSVPAGKTFGVVGESGSGKTTTALAIMRLVPITHGRVILGDTAISDLEKEELRAARRRFQIIFQDPYSSLDPRKRAGAVVREPLDLMQIGKPAERDGMVAELFGQVGLRPEQRALFPHQFSGGQRQRIGLARALSTRPDLIVCDEPVSALDVAIQAQILNLMAKLQRELGLTYLFISHDLGVVQHICDQIAVMYLGQIVEQADRISLFTNPRHPYTKALLAAVPTVHGNKRDRRSRMRLKGDPPSPINLPPGCRFASRCPMAEARCREASPPLEDRGGGHRVSCFLV
ncbi:MAG: ATP-binding cassette domain-containing protein [Rhodospirillales bacterium]|nr:ATP-binding cassette domain-containing protein [Rhodospirillales bacterium]MDH3913207.1 ATP-binding cassette domain-containing protein [Rhodospirillales bacterium]MDH3919449.1 ATP-binding cassette domain-containing protein [Rhodospirillales bacterium]MDH3968031.1 ATP-binding cassette domain-containing protein [Rhodospirillales bacterium]